MARQVDAVKLSGVAAPDAGNVVPGAAWCRVFRAALDGAASTAIRRCGRRSSTHPQATSAAATLAAAFGFPATTPQALPALGRREGAPLMARMLYDPPNFL